MSAALFLRQTLLPKLPLFDEPSQFGLAADTVRFPSTDGIELEGWTINGHPGRPWLILCHGVGSNRSDLLDIGARLYLRGFNILWFDFRAHGGSPGRTTSFGLREQRDLEGALAFLGRQADVPDRPCGVYGISMGGAVALMVAARDERLGAVAVDSPYTSLDDSLALHLRLLCGLPRQPFLWALRATYRLRFGAWPAVVSPLAAAPKLSPRALLVIQGADDVRAPVRGAQEIYEASNDPKEMWLVRGAGHLEGFPQYPERYVGRLSQFFESHLK